MKPNNNQKSCRYCKKFKNLSEFSTGAKKNICKACVNLQARKAHKKNYSRRDVGLFAPGKRVRNREMQEAHSAVAQAVASKIIYPPASCTLCRKSGIRLEAHHHDYNKPLDVVYLCVACHCYIHKEVLT